MYEYHYWKCYHKEGPTFQTASLYSVEVDYYHFGTCEITDGAYFCGDHSCNTFKHIGNLDVRENSILDNPALQWAFGADHPLQNADGTTARSAAQTAEYDHFDGLFLTQADLAHEYRNRLGSDYTGVFANQIAGWPAEPKGSAVPLHLQENLKPGLCRARCNADTECKAYQESRWEAHWKHRADGAQCWLFKMSRWVSRYSDTPLDASAPFWGSYEAFLADGSYAGELADFYAKYYDASAPHGSWGFMPRNPGAMGNGNDAQTRRRLAGVY